MYGVPVLQPHQHVVLSVFWICYISTHTYIYIHKYTCHCVWRSAVSNSFATPWTACSLPGSSVHGIFQARTLEWIAISFFKRSSRAKDQTQGSCIGKQILYHWATWEAPYIYIYLHKYAHICICINIYVITHTHIYLAVRALCCRLRTFSSCSVQALCGTWA